MATGNVTVRLNLNSTGYSAGMAAAQKSMQSFTASSQAMGHATVSSAMAASAAIRVVEGNVTNNIRAAERFIATIPGVGRALQLAFPVVGAIAFAGVIGELVKRVVEFIDKANKMPVALQNGFRAMNISAETSIDSLNLSTAKMQEQIALLSGKRPNTLAADLADAALAADKLATALDGDNQKIKQLLSEQHLGAIGAMFTNTAGTAVVEGSVNSFDQQLADASAKYQHAVRTNDPSAAARLKDLDDKRAAAQAWVQQQTALRSKAAGPSQQDNLAILSGFGNVLADQQDMEGAEKNNKAAAAKLRELEEAKKFAELSKKAQQDLLKQDEEEEKRKNAFNKLTINEEIQFWTDRIGAFTRGGDQYITVQDKIYDLIAKRPSLFSENKKNQAEVGKSQVEGNDILGRAQQSLITGPAIEQQERMAEAAKKYNEIVAQGDEIQRKSATAFAEISISTALAQGSISNLGAAQALSAVHAHDHADALELVNKALQEQIRLISEQPDSKMSPQEKAAATARAQDEAGNQTNAINGAYARVQAQDQASISGDTISGAVKNALGEMVQSFTDMAANLKNVIPRTIEGLNDDIAKLTTGQGRKGDFGRTFKQAGEGLVKTGLQGAEGGILSLLTHGKLGPKRDGSAEAAALWVQIANAGTGAPSSVSTSSPARSAAVGLASLIPGGSFIQPFISSLLPHFAGGGDVMANHPSIIGENGPELFTPSSAGTITPNSALGGGGTHFHIDARGATDPSAVNSAIMRAAPHIIAASMQTQHAAAKRSPRGR